MSQRDDLLLEVRAASCALPPRKPTTPAKATGHDKGGKVTAHPGVRSAKTPANGKKSTGGKSLFKGSKKTSSHGVAKTRTKVNSGAKVKAAAAFKKAATHAAGKKVATHAAGKKVATHAAGKKAATHTAATHTAAKKSTSFAKIAKTAVKLGRKK